MSYDLYCYKSKLGTPDIDEAIAVIEAGEEDITACAQPDTVTKLKIAKALIDLNPRLESFDFDYDEIAKIQGISVDKAKHDFDHIELNTPEGDLATQITIFDNNVSITVPYWYTGDKAQQVFEKVNGYARVVKQVTGYFVYDPQTEEVYDPTTSSGEGLAAYTAITSGGKTSIAKPTNQTRSKPWWKFW